MTSPRYKTDLEELLSRAIWLVSTRVGAEPGLRTDIDVTVELEAILISMRLDMLLDDLANI